MIQAVSQSGSENRDPAGATIINGAGKYLTPGFIDTHVHIAVGIAGFDMSDGTPKLKMDMLDDVHEYSLRMLAANGITTSRDPGGKTEVTTIVKKKLKMAPFSGLSYLWPVQLLIRHISKILFRR